MNEFSFYLGQGIEHITDPTGIDHMLFVITLCAIYRVNEWKKVLVLISGFTIGHSITLALSSLDIISINQNLIEVLIPVTILITSIGNVLQKDQDRKMIGLNYLAAMGFGLIHGMGFSNFFRSMMMGIEDGNIIMPLLGFNVGVELGQAIIVMCYMLVLFIANRILSIPPREWNLYISGAGGGVAITMIIERIL